MKRILFLILLIGTLSAQVTSVPMKYNSDITHPGSNTNVTSWYQQTVFIDSGDTQTEPIVISEPLIGIAITRNMVWDSVTTTRNDDYHWDSSWTASDLGFLVGHKRESRAPSDTTWLTDTTFTIESIGVSQYDTLDFMPMYDDSDTSGASRYFVTVDSMRYVKINPDHFSGIKYLIIECINKTSWTAVAQEAKRTLVLFYRKY